MLRPFLTRRWILLTLLLIVFLTGFFVAGFWQLGRYNERRAENAIQTSHGALPVAPIEDVLAPDASASAAKATAYRRVSVTGTYDVTHEVVFLSRSFEGISGNELLTPLVAKNGVAVIVDRGWVPLLDTKPAAADALPPKGTVTIDGVLLPSQRRGLFGPKLPAKGYIEGTLRIDIPRLRQQLPYAAYPMYVLLRAQQPAQPGTFPKPVALPPPDGGPFLSYTIQWFCFALIAIATYIALGWRTLRRARDGASDGAPMTEDVRV